MKENIKLNNQELVKNWIKEKISNTKIKGFYPEMISKELKIPVEEIYIYCEELARIDKIIELHYRYSFGKFVVLYYFTEYLL